MCVAPPDGLRLIGPPGSYSQLAPPSDVHHKAPSNRAQAPVHQPSSIAYAHTGLVSHRPQLRGSKRLPSPSPGSFFRLFSPPSLRSRYLLGSPFSAFLRSPHCGQLASLSPPRSPPAWGAPFDRESHRKNQLEAAIQHEASCRNSPVEGFTTKESLVLRIRLPPQPPMTRSHEGMR